MKRSRITATYYKYALNFKIPGGTSRGVLKKKDTYFLVIESGGKKGIGECALFRGLSSDDLPDYEDKLDWLCRNINLETEELMHDLKQYPSIQFGLEQAKLSLDSSQGFDLFPSRFSKGKDKIPINGLIWMGDQEFMLKQIEEKINLGFDTLKLKIGAIDFDTELNLIKGIRDRFSANEITLRVDANGAFGFEEAFKKLEQLAQFDIHSIEQPIQAGQLKSMAQLVKQSPVPIALDEELIGIVDDEMKDNLINEIQPPFIILKPSLIGGFSGSLKWIERCAQNGIDWWITSALESNIGLNAIAQFCYTLNNPLPQGLGTGGLFTNNLNSPLTVENGQLYMDPDKKWDEWKDLINLDTKK
jgi:o-succinylbenzoate synthase